MARWTHERTARDPIRAVIRAKCVAYIAENEASIARMSPEEKAEMIYPVEHFADYARRRLADIDEGRPLAVGRWELPRGTEVPALAHNYLVHADGRITVPPRDLPEHHIEPPAADEIPAEEPAPF